MEEYFSVINVALATSSRREARRIAKKYVGRLLASFQRLTPGVESQPGALPPGGMVSRSPLIESLSKREMEVWGLIVTGMSNREIAEQLIIGEGTVKTRINKIYGKLDVESRTRAIARARELKLL